MNELLYQRGGTLILDEAFESQPASATLTLRTMRDEALSELDSTFSDIESAACTCDDLELTLTASAKSAKILVPSATSGTIPDITDDGYRLLIKRGGRKHWASISEYDVSGSNVESFRIDEGIDFPIKAGDKAYGIRVSYDVDWSAVTDDYTGQLKAVWVVTLDTGAVHVVGKVYDVVRQALSKQATWADVIDRRPDADDHMSEIRDKERFVDVAWEDIVRKLYHMDIRHNLVIPDYSTVLRDATVMQCIYNLTMHQSMPAPNLFLTQGQDYLDWLDREIERALGQFTLPMDLDENGIITPIEESNARRGAWFRR